MDRQQDFVLRTVEERDIRFIRLWFTDVLGILKSVAIAPAELESAFGEGIGFDGSAIEGLTRVVESDMLAKPDPSTFQVLPWRGDRHGTARMFCDIQTPDGEPSSADPRGVLKRALAKASDRGFTFYVHPEIEFYLFETPAEPDLPLMPVDSGGYFDHVPRGTGHDFRRAAISMLESMGISVEFSHHEAGPGQNEIDLRYADALTTADNVMTFRTVVKEVALEQGLFASFMPKPMANHPGSGMHSHLSLFEGDRNGFHEPGAPMELSATGTQVHRRAAAPLGRDHRDHQPVRQLLQAAVGWRRGAELHLLGAQQPLGAGPRADVQAGQGQLEPRGVPRDRLRGQPLPVLRGMLAAGLKGIEEGYELPDGAEDDVWELTDSERRALGIQPLPSSLEQAVAVMERSELVAETLGEHVFDYVLRNKREEWEAYRAQVTAFELKRYLPVL